MSENKNFDEIFKILNNYMKNYAQPIVSRKKEKINDTPFNTLISCILSLRTKDEITEKASIRLLSENDTPEKIIKLSEEKIASLIYPVGFYKTKAKRILEISQTLINKYSSQVPNDFNELLKLNGVGKKTAAIVMVYGHKIDNYIPVDVHVHVIANRLGWISTDNPDQSMEQLMKVVPKRYWYDLNELFVTFGQNLCLTVSPWCSKCPIEHFCKKIGVKKRR